MPCEWNETDIIVLYEVCISPPYTPKSCSGKGAALKHIKKVLAGVLKRLEHTWCETDPTAHWTDPTAHWMDPL